MSWKSSPELHNKANAALVNQGFDSRKTRGRTKSNPSQAGWRDEDLIVDLPVRMPVRIRYPESIVNQVRTLAVTMTDLQIAEALNQAQLRSASRK